MESAGSAPHDPSVQASDLTTLTPPEAAIAPPAPAPSPSNRPNFPFKQKSLWPAALLAMAVILVMVGLKAYRKIQQAPALEESVSTISRLPVRVAKARNGLAQGWVFDEGTVWPVQRRVLNFEDSGEVTFITKIAGRELREGDRVPQGQLLATIDSRNQSASITTANADVMVTIQQQDQAEADLLKAKAQRLQAQSELDLQRSELSRYQQLFDQGAVSASDRDVYINRVTQAEAALLSADQDIRSAEDGLQSAEAQIVAAGARLKQSSVAMEDTQLVSPIDGIVAYLNIREGEYWSPSRLDSSSDQRLIETAPIVVVDPFNFEVELEIQSDEANSIQRGQTAYVVLEEEVSAAQAAGASNNDLLQLAKAKGSIGAVFSVSPTETPGSRGTKITLRDLTNTERLKVGGRVYAWVEVAANANTVMIPPGALLPRDQKYYTFVVKDDDTVTRREVIPGVESFDGVEILSGVRAGESVVIEGENRLVEGTPVEVVDIGGAE